MQIDSRKKWDQKYAVRASRRPPAPADWLLAHLNRLPAGRAVDLATGLGRCAVELARTGRNVTAVDISEVGIRIARDHADRMGVHIDWVVADLESFRLPSEHFDVVTVFNYLDRTRLPSEIVRALRPGGMLLFETFTLNQLQVPGTHIKNPDHMLRPGELLSMFPGLRVRAYRDIVQPDRAVASLIAAKLSDEW